MQTKDFNFHVWEWNSGFLSWVWGGSYSWVELSHKAVASYLPSCVWWLAQPWHDVIKQRPPSPSLNSAPCYLLACFSTLLTKRQRQGQKKNLGGSSGEHTPRLSQQKHWPHQIQARPRTGYTHSITRTATTTTTSVILLGPCHYGLPHWIHSCWGCLR